MPSLKEMASFAGVNKFSFLSILATAHNIAKKKIFSFFSFIKAQNTPIAKGLALFAVVFLRDAPCRVGMKRVGSYEI
jgi:hypothetical protein